MKKNKIQELLDSNNNIIGLDDFPTQNTTLISADGTTDHNVAIGHQHFTNSYLGLMGFYFEGENSEGGNLLTEIAKLKYANFQKTIKDLGKNPKSFADYRKMVEKDFDKLSEEETKSDYEFAKQILDIIKKNSKLVEAEPKDKPLDESEIHKIIEDVLSSKKDTSMSFKKTDNDILSDKFKKIKSLFSDLSDREKGELVKQLK